MWYKKEGLPVTSNSCHPGLVNTSLPSRLGFPAGNLSITDGADTPSWLASDPSLREVSGKYFTRRQEVPDAIANAEEMRRAAMEKIHELLLLPYPEM
jgi:hypothetical protein